MINKIGTIPFAGKIIDSHVHTGQWRINSTTIHDYGPAVDTFTKSKLPNGDKVEKVIASNLDCIVQTSNFGESVKFASDEIQGNVSLLKMSYKNPKIAPLATCQPSYGEVENIETLFELHPNKFVGLKFHPEQLQLPADHEAYKPYLEFAQDEKLPCLFHSGQTFDMHYPDGGVSKATKFSTPEQIYTAARQYPDVPVIMAHMGGNEGKNTMRAVDCIIDSVKNKDARLYADISWVDCDNPEKPTLKKAIHRLKEADALDRIMFGTDAPLGRFGLNGENGVPPLEAYTNNVNDIKTMIKKEFPKDAEEITDKIFYKNANDLFFKKHKLRAQKNRITTAVAVGAGLLAFGIYCLNKVNNTK